MNIFQKKLRQISTVKKPIDPISLFTTLYHKEGYGYLRGIQEEVLTIWNDKRTQRDVVIKMNTGSGKTLTGLLMLYSKLVEGIGPAVYICPDKQLILQTLGQASNYGIPTCAFDEQTPRVFPHEFINNKSILVCTSDKLFNGLTIFNSNSIKLGCVVLDDAHTCIKKFRKQCTIRVPKRHEIYGRMLNLFKEELQIQAAGTFQRLCEGDTSVVICVPYWSWIYNNKTVIKIISEFGNEINLKFIWPLISDDLLTCNCYFSTKGLEISPIHAPYHEIPSFDEAKFRYVLSATFDDNTDLLKDLGISKDSIMNPIIPKDRKDIGQRLILAPSRYDTKLNSNIMEEYISNISKRGVNVVVLVSSGTNATKWVKLGAMLVDKDNINESLKKLKDSKGNFMVFLNRYDGIDLHGDMCRVLVLDGKPSFTTLEEKYLVNIRAKSSIFEAANAQIIEQGIGRAVRSGSDYCVVYLLGTDLVTFLSYNKNLQYFSPVTSEQLNLGLTLLDGEDKAEPLKTIEETEKLCLDQDESWREYHSNTLLQIKQENISGNTEQNLMIAELEANTIKKFRQRDYKGAYDEITKIFDAEVYTLTDKDKAWYMQFAAHMVYCFDKAKANDLQVASAKASTKMFHPKNGMIYTKLSKPGVQSALISKNISLFDRPQDIAIYIEGILNSLKYNPDIEAEFFERSLCALGEFLGFSSERPEQDLGNGPDVLWCMTDGHFLVMEAKSRSTHNKITRSNIEQLLHSEEWFTKQYGKSASYSAITLQPPFKKENNAIAGKNQFAIDKECLEKLHSNLRLFVNSLQCKQTKEHSAQEISEKLKEYKLTPGDFRQTYLKKLH